MEINEFWGQRPFPPFSSGRNFAHGSCLRCRLLPWPSLPPQYIPASKSELVNVSLRCPPRHVFQSWWTINHQQLPRLPAHFSSLSPLEAFDTSLVGVNDLPNLASTGLSSPVSEEPLENIFFFFCNHIRFPQQYKILLNEKTHLTGNWVEVSLVALELLFLLLTLQRAGEWGWNADSMLALLCLSKVTHHNS